MKTRADVVVRRTYARPHDDDETRFETWTEICERVAKHQLWLWERAKGSDLDANEIAELEEFKQLMIERKVSVSGRTLWLGNTDVAKQREASQFNCSFTQVETVYDVVDVLWLLMQGCGVGFKPITGTLNGFKKPIKNIEVIRTKRKEKGGLEYNEESYCETTRTWRIKVGDSAESWAKSIGKLLAGKRDVDTLILDFSELRPAGTRLKGYGWISSGDEAISVAYQAIAKIMNQSAGQLLTRMDILDLINWLGTILSSRRSAQIALFEYDQPEWEEFAVAKRNYWQCKDCGSDYTKGNVCQVCGSTHVDIQRVQSNNSLLFYKKPSKKQLQNIFDLMIESGGSEPGFINAETATARAPWFRGSNPCCEILLGNKTFCNLVEIDIAKFKGDTTGLHRAIKLSARANYRQTCVDLRDGILQESWHLQNEFLRLCGVGLTGISQRDDLSAYDIETMKRVAIHSAYSMADELGLQKPKNVTTVKPSGTLSKVMSTTEGVHRPLGKYIFNNINFGPNDPMLPILRDAGYEVYPNPNMPTEGVLVKFPIKWDNIKFDKYVRDNGEVIEVNNESAIGQLERYKKYQVHWCQQNVSNTISYSVDEVPQIINWFMENWEIYVGVSFLFRADPTKTAKDLGYMYLPQEVTTEAKYNEYVANLKPVNLDKLSDSMENEMDSQECSGGSCPVK